MERNYGAIVTTPSGFRKIVGWPQSTPEAAINSARTFLKDMREPYLSIEAATAEVIRSGEWR